MKTKLSRFAVPYVVWMAIFVVAPIVIMVIYAFSNGEGGATLDNFVQMGGYAAVFGRSFKLALIATAICLLIGYPAAYFLSREGASFQRTAMVLIMLPMWINFLLRTIATVELFHMFGLPLGEGALLFGMVYDFLPFMIYPIYNTLQKMDMSLVEAAQDLGANRFKVFTKVILPLSMPGVYSGIIMVFMPTVSTFAISELLTHNKITLFGSLIQRSFSEGGITMWNYGAALSLILLIIIGMTSFFGQKDENNREGGIV